MVRNATPFEALYSRMAVDLKEEIDAFLAERSYCQVTRDRVEVTSVHVSIMGKTIPVLMLALPHPQHMNEGHHQMMISRVAGFIVKASEAHSGTDPFMAYMNPFFDHSKEVCHILVGLVRST